mgnify:CR=1 FL=1
MLLLLLLLLLLGVDGWRRECDVCVSERRCEWRSRARVYRDYQDYRDSRIVVSIDRTI